MDFPNRDWNWINKYYEELLGDVYPQPDEGGRTEITKEILCRFPEIKKAKNVLDVGCGEGFLQELLRDDCIYLGITLSEQDFAEAQAKGRIVMLGDFNFLPFARYPDERKFDLVFASHVLEHSPMPLLTLMEWYRVSNEYLCLVMPNPAHYTYFGRNHYSVSNKQHIKWLLRRAGWKVVKKYFTDTDLAFFCEKHDRIGYEGYAEIPLPIEIHNEELEE
jgi:ubiquinone/menaquinone biosynthesis C-methylase UbiE